MPARILCPDVKKIVAHGARVDGRPVCICHGRTGSNAHLAALPFHQPQTHPISQYRLQTHTQPHLQPREQPFQPVQPGQGAGRRHLLVSCSLLALLPAFPTTCEAAIVEEDISDAVFRASVPSVVSIADFKVEAKEEVAEGTGTGVVWDSLGHIVTNYHCVAQMAKGAPGTQVTRVGFLSPSGQATEFLARLVASDPAHDLAVLAIDATPAQLAPMRLGTSADLRVGQAVFAIGNPYGLSRTLTAGVVSGLNRAIPSPTGQRINGAIQTDAAISSGNSGGPLLDSSGRMVGINTATFTRSGSGRSSGVNFALPVDLVRQIVPRLIVYHNASGKGV